MNEPGEMSFHNSPKSISHCLLQSFHNEIRIYNLHQRTVVRGSSLIIETEPLLNGSIGSNDESPLSSLPLDKSSCTSSPISMKSADLRDVLTKKLSICGEASPLLRCFPRRIIDACIIWHNLRNFRFDPKR